MNRAQRRRADAGNPIPVQPAPPEATTALHAALDAMDFGIATPFQRRGNIMAAPDVLAAAAMRGRYPKRQPCD